MFYTTVCRLVIQQAKCKDFQCYRVASSTKFSSLTKFSTATSWKTKEEMNVMEQCSLAHMPPTFIFLSTLLFIMKRYVEEQSPGRWIYLHLWCQLLSKTSFQSGGCSSSVSFHENRLWKREGVFWRWTSLLTLWDGVDVVLHFLSGGRAGVSPQGLF